MDLVFTVFTQIIFGILIANCFLALYYKEQKLLFLKNLSRKLKLSMILEIPLLLLVTALVAIGLIKLIPLLGWGWGKIIFGTTANIAVAPILTSATSGNLWLKIPGFMAMCLLLYSMPFFVWVEEIDYRKGHIEWKPICIQSVKFGLIHLIMGIPIAMALALSIPGFVFACKYRKAYLSLERLTEHEREEHAVMASTAYHAVYNCVIILLLSLLFFI
jgi:hypothetical protein